MRVIAELLAGFWAQACAMFDSFVRFITLPTEEVSDMILIGVVLACVFPIMVLWTDRRGVARKAIVLASLAVPGALMLVLTAPAGYRGLPDDNCAHYDDGKLVFSLIGLVLSPRDPHELMGEEDLILLVQAPRWGAATHQCRLPLSDPRIRELRDALQSQTQPTEGGRPSRGTVSFSFGGQNERPNVTARPMIPPGKIAPPEVPPNKRYGA